MGYKTPHHAREWFGAAALQVCHEFRLRAQYRSRALTRDFLEESKEIDLHWRLAAFFGTSASVSANGSSDIDVVVSAPTLGAEVKYLVPGRSQAEGVQKDWQWLLGFKNVNKDFGMFAWVVFLPGVKHYTFTECHSVRKPPGRQYDWNAIAPYLPFAEPYMPAAGAKEKLRWRSTFCRTSAVRLSGGKTVRADLIGSHTDALWAVVYTRLAPNERGADQMPVVFDASKGVMILAGEQTA